MYESLWKHFALGRLELSNRLVMAPMTRSRAGDGGVPHELNAQYYAQRAGLGLVISEGTQPSEDGQGYMSTPGIHNQAQTAGWQLVADAVHAEGGHLFIQLMHTGRVGHPDNTPHHRMLVAPSAVHAVGMMFTASGPQDMPAPRALAEDEIGGTIDDFRRAAALAITAGADGVEIHAANGYLLHQFLAENTNRRTDGYGGSIDNRIRFVVKTAAAVAEEIGHDRTGIRISPGNPFNDIDEGNTHELYQALVPALARLDLAYLHVMHMGDEDLLHWIRGVWDGPLIVNRGGRPADQIAVDVDAGTADLASVGALALANPDLVERLQAGAPLNDPDPTGFYGGAGGGYTDYPALPPAA